MIDDIDLVYSDDSSPLQGIRKTRIKGNNLRVFDKDTWFSDEDSVQPGTNSCSGTVIDVVESSENVESSEKALTR